MIFPDDPAVAAYVLGALAYGHGFELRSVSVSLSVDGRAWDLSADAGDACLETLHIPVEEASSEPRSREQADKVVRYAAAKLRAPRASGFLTAIETPSPTAVAFEELRKRTREALRGVPVPGWLSRASVGGDDS